MKELKLLEFQQLYQQWKRGIPWWDLLLLGALKWLEDKVIEVRVTHEVDKAINEYVVVEPPLPDLITPVYTERPSEASVSLPEMRLTAPWYKEKEKSN